MPFFFFFKKRESEREATTKPVQWNCSEGPGSGPNFVFGGRFPVCVRNALEEGFCLWGLGTPRSEFLEFV